MGKNKMDGGDDLQLGLVQMQLAHAQTGERTIIVLEGRDSAGKDGTIKALTEHLSVRSTRVVALPKPNDREKGAMVSATLRRAIARGGRARDLQPQLVQSRGGGGGQRLLDPGRTGAVPEGRAASSRRCWSKAG